MAVTPPLRPALFAAVLAPMVACQIVRLYQADGPHWIVWDYLSRLSGLAVVLLLKDARSIALRHEKLAMPVKNAVFLIILLVLFESLMLRPAIDPISVRYPALIVHGYPRLHGGLYLLDLSFGLLLVAVSEEVVFRRLAASMLGGVSANRLRLVSGSAVLFGLYHWSTSVPNAIGAALIGIPLMLFYLRARALWPVLTTHYLIDFTGFV